MSHPKNLKNNYQSLPEKSPQSNLQNSSGHPRPLARLFSNIPSRKEVLQAISEQESLSNTFLHWSKPEQEFFLDCCTGIRGVKVLYDGIFKEIFNPELTPQRLEELLSLLLERKVTIRQVLPNDSVRLGAESSLLYTDIIVQLEDGSLSNIEVQKIGYKFPGQRCACYSADHLLRQYKRVRNEHNRQNLRFNYQKIKDVYTIVFFEQSPKEFHGFKKQWIHRFRQKSDTGLHLELLEKYCFIPLDIFKENMENKPIGNDLEAWLSFLSYDEPKRIEELITSYPRFRAMYQDIYEICKNMERVMNMYSKELEELDHNTVMYMIDEMQEELNEAKRLLDQKDNQLIQKDEQLIQNASLLEQQAQLIRQLQSQLAMLQPSS